MTTLYSVKSLVINRGDFFNCQFPRYLEDPQQAKTREYLRHKEHPVGDTDQTYQRVMEWYEAGLLLDSGSTHAKDTLYSVTEHCWFHVLYTLDNLKIDADQLADTKQSILSISGKYQGARMLEFYISRVLEGDKVSLIITPSGEAVLLTEGELEHSQTTNPLPLFVGTISINHICSVVLSKPNFAKRDYFKIPLFEKEVELMDRLTSDEKLDEIVLQPKNGKVHRVAYKTRTSNPKEIFSKLKKNIATGGRGEATLKYQDGKILLYEEVEKR